MTGARPAGTRRLIPFVALGAAFVLGIGGTLLYQNRSELLGAGHRGNAAPPVVLIGLDGADWNIIDPLLAAGKLPNLAGLIEKGSRARLLTISPTLSPVIWTTIATGVKPERHGIVDFTAVNNDTGAAVPVTSNLRRVPALWNILSDAGRSVGFVGWWASFPAEKVNGYIVSDRIAYQLFGVKSDDSSQGKTWPTDAFDKIKPLIVVPQSVPDSFAARFLDDPSVLQTTNPEYQDLLRQFKTILASGESYRKIAATLQSQYKPDVESVYIEGTDTIAHLFMRFRPPLMPGVTSDEAHRFASVVDRYYVYADELVGEIVARHGPRATYVICSDHGFRTGQDRPITADSRIDRGRGAEWHRKYGILIVSGAAAKPHAEVREATVFDIAPTVLALAGVAIPPNLDGRVLTDTISDEFLAAHPLRSLDVTPSPTPAPGDGKVATSRGTGGGSPIATDDDEEIRQKLISLGYLTQESNNAHNNRGILLLGRGEYDQAIAEFHAAMRDNPRFAAGYINIARAWWQKGDSAHAIENLHKAEEIDASMKEVPLMLGNIAMKAGDLQTAEREFLRALALEPNDADTLNCLGLVYDSRRDYARAESYFTKATQVDPDFAEGFNNLGNIMKRRGDAAKAETYYHKAIDADPFFMGAYANLALVFQERGDFDRAADLYRQALTKDNANPDLHNNLGSLLFKRGDLPAAEEAFRRAIALDKKYAEGHNSLGVVFGAQGKDQQEKAEYEKAIELKPGYADALYNLGLWFLRHDDDKGAEKSLREAIRLRPDSPPAIATLAGLYLHRGDAHAARPLATRALALQPDNPRICVLNGEVAFALGDREGARKSLRRALEIQPGQNDVEELLKKLDAKP